MIDVNMMKAVVVTVAGEKEVRYYLQGVCLDNTEQGAFLVSTDGHRMTAIKASGTPLPGVPLGRVVIPTETVKLAISMNRGSVTMEYSDNVWSINHVRFTPIDGIFPDWRRIIPHEFNGEAGQYNPRYVQDAFKAAALYCGASLKKFYDNRVGGFANFHQNGMIGTAALLLDNDPNFISIVMPIREPKNDKRWFTTNAFK